MKFLTLKKAKNVALDFKAKRIKQVVLSAQASLLIVILQLLYSEGFSPVVVALSLAIVVLFAVPFLVNRDKLELGSSILIIGMISMISALVFTSDGLRGSGILGFAGVIIFASLLGTFRLFIGVVIYIFALILTLGYLGEINVFNPAVIPINLRGSISYLVIFFVIAFSVWMLSKDLKSLLVQLQDEIIKTKDSQAEVEFLAHHDALTGLANRAISRDRFEHCIAHNDRTHKRIALLFLDLDNFKVINDSLGHDAGDSVLIEVTRRLQRVVRHSDTICRHGGDEFLIILEDIEDTDAIIRVVDSIIAALNKVIKLNHNEVLASCSLGIAVAPEDGTEFDMLLKKADTAMYASKEAGRNTYRFYDEQMNKHMSESIKINAQIRQALAAQQFEVHYQPQFDLNDNTQGDKKTLIGCEALIRWFHPEDGMIPPFKFIPIAEQSGLIVDIGEWVLYEACRQCKKWVDLGHTDFVMAVNLSSVQFKRGNIEDLVLNVLEDTGLPGKNLELELTESLLIDDSESFKAILKRLQAVGVKFSIDDFGTGYSNLGYLKKFEVETLKIDQSFIRNMMIDEQDFAIVRAILQMASSIGLKTIAEGIEDKNSLTALINLGCDSGQGYYWSTAKPAVVFEQTFLLENHPEK